MSRLLFFVLLLLVLYALWKTAQRRGRVAKQAAPTLKKPLSPAQQTLFARLQTALPSTLIMVQPALGQLLELSDQTLAQTLVDFAVCRKDSSPLGVVLLDADKQHALIEKTMLQAGLKYAHFRSEHLPSEQALRDALGFL